MTIKLNFGCGLHRMPDFFNVDVDENFPTDSYLDLRKGLSFPIEYADLIYASWLLQCFTYDDAVVALVQWKSILKPDGILRLSVPDLEACLWVYMKYGQSDHINRLLHGCDGSFHSSWDYYSLQKVLKEAGYSNIRHWNYRETDHACWPDSSGTMLKGPDGKETLTSLNVEADR